MIVKMKRVTIVAPKRDEEQVMKALQRKSAVQLIDEPAPAADQRDLARAENMVLSLKSSIALLSPYCDKDPMLSVKPEIELPEIEKKLAESSATIDKLCKLDSSRSVLVSRADKCKLNIDQLTPWKDMEAPLELVRPTRSVGYIMGIIDAGELENVMALCGDNAVESYPCPPKCAILIACPKCDIEDLGRQLKTMSFSEVSFSKFTGTAKENISAQTAELASISKELEAFEGEFKALGGQRKELAMALDGAVIYRDRVKAICALTLTQATVILEGWVREDEAQTVHDAITEACPAIYMETRDPSEDEVPPSVVKNSKLIEPYEAVTNLYSRPDPNGIDGTPLMAPFYFLFFGMMLSDTGYGLVLFLGGLIFQRIYKPIGAMGGIVKVLIMGGLSTIVCGFFIGTFFGMDWNVLFGTAPGTFPLLFDPMTEPMNMLYLCFGLGLFHMLFGVCVKIYMCIKQKDYVSAIFDNASWLMVIIGILLFALVPAVSTIGMIMAGAGLLMVLFFAGRTRKTFLKRMIKGAGSLYDITSYLSDMLSYARVFALGLSTGVIGTVLNTLGSMFNSAFSGGFIMQGIGFVLTAALLVALHIFSLGINVLGCFIHTARLQYVEFYGKFYDAGGKEFKPLGYKTRKVRVVTK